MSAEGLYKKLCVIGGLIAHHMAGSWRRDSRPIEPDDYYYGAVILGPDNLSIRLQDGGRMRKNGMIYINGIVPNFGLSHNERRAAVIRQSSKSINVSWSRTPKSIAGDIQRRLMPDYIAAVAKAQGEVDQFKTRMETLKYLEHAFQKVAPTLRNYRGHACNVRREYTFSSGHEYRTHKLELSNYSSGLNCNLELSDLTPDMAMRIIAMLQEEMPDKI